MSDYPNLVLPRAVKSKVRRLVTLVKRNREKEDLLFNAICAASKFGKTSAKSDLLFDHVYNDIKKNIDYV